MGSLQMWENWDGENIPVLIFSGDTIYFQRANGTAAASFFMCNLCHEYFIVGSIRRSYTRTRQFFVLFWVHMIPIFP